MRKEIEKRNKEGDNPYLLLDFWEFAIMSTLMVVFFPWSLLFCVVFQGLTETKYIVLALIHDAVKTFFAILSIAGSLIILIVIIIFLLNIFI